VAARDSAPSRGGRRVDARILAELPKDQRSLSRASDYSKEDIVAILNENADGLAITEACRRYGITDSTFYRWRRRYGSESRAELLKVRLSRLTALEGENRWLRSVVAALGAAAPVERHR
jgi:putative transposase